MKANPSGPAGLALQGASAALRGLGVESTTPSAARLASAPLQSQRGSRGILRQAPRRRLSISLPLNSYLCSDASAKPGRGVTCRIMSVSSFQEPFTKAKFGKKTCLPGPMEDFVS